MAIKIGIIGCGNMGIAFTEQLKARYDLFVFDKDQNKLKSLKGANVAAGSIDLVSRVDIVMLAVKPQDIAALLKEIRKVIGSKIIISIAAGINTAYLEKMLGEVKVIRAMPNIGIKIGESVTCLCRGASVADADFDLCREIFYYLGVTKEIKEEMMDAATAISGSGPAYVFFFVESEGLDAKNIPEHTRHDIMKRLEGAAQKIGFNHEDAAFLAVNTVNTSINLLKKTGLSASELRKQVTSKGGTTEAALQVLEKAGTWDDAAQAALKRAQELSGKE